MGPRFRGDDKVRDTGTGIGRDAFFLEKNACARMRVRAMADKRIRENPDQSRQAVKGHGLRYVLAFGLSGAAIAMVIVYFAFFS